MGLFQAVDQRLETNEFLNDTILFVGGYLTWEQLVTQNSLDSQESLEHSASVTYWQDLYDAATEQRDKDLVRVRMDSTLNHAYEACDRNQVTEAEFLAIIGAETVLQRINRPIPLSDDRPENDCL